MDELVDQTKALISFQDVKVQVYPYQIAFNLLPQVGSFGDGGIVREEVKIVQETRKILDMPTPGSRRRLYGSRRLLPFRSDQRGTERPLKANDAGGHRGNARVIVSMTIR